ncbi:transposase, partial [Pseudomonas aeruginosa]|uniref:transposase n=1 Tax=Pseudomonas aeruginosa TaxID=287 RepID=UPI003C6E8559
IYTITNDNGSEFRGEPIKEVRVYHCDPMKPQQRGTVENTIGMLRRHITRQTDLETMTDADIKDIEDRMNLRPRKILGYMTPYEMFYKTKVALAV